MENCALLGKWVLVISYRRFGTTDRPRPLTDVSRQPYRSQRTHGTIRCPEMSERNYHYWLRNNPEERSSKLPRGGSLKSRISNNCPFGFFQFVFYFFILVLIFYTVGHNTNYSFCFCREMCGTLSPSYAFRLLDVLSVLPGLTIYMNRKTQSRKLYNSTMHCLVLSRLRTSDDNLNMFSP